MFTERMRIPCTGTFAPNFSETPSLGWMRRTRAFASSPSDASREKSWCGAARNCHLFVAHRLVVERRRRLHRDQGEELQEVVLDDVAHRACLLVVAGAFFDADRLGDCDLNVVDVLPIPDRLEDAVREPHDEDVLDGLFAEVVIDAEDLVLTEDGVEDLGELARRLAVATERFLDAAAGPPRRPTQAVAPG